MEVKEIFSIYCSLFHVSIQSDINLQLDSIPIFLSKNEEYVKTWRRLHPRIEFFFGKLYLDSLQRNPFFHCRIELTYNESSQMMIAIASNLESYLNSLWLIKDHSINIDKLFLQGGDLHFSSSGAQKYSTSKGEYTNTIFSSSDLFDGLTFYHKLNMINSSLRSPAEDAPGFDPSFKSGIKSALLNDTYYDNFNRITKAWLFVKGARVQTHLPAKIAFFIAALESLFSTSDKFIQANVCNRAAKYISKGQVEIDRTHKFLKKMYDFRSNYIHGRQLRIASQTTTIAPNIVELETVIRRILVKIINQDSELFMNNHLIKSYLESLFIKKN